MSAAYPSTAANKSAAKSVIAASFDPEWRGALPRAVGDRWGA